MKSVLKLDPVNNLTNCLHPAAQEIFTRFDQHLQNSPACDFERFEGWRSPLRQQQLRSLQPPVTKSNPWYSVHQYGFACDYVMKLDGKWTWHEADNSDFAQLHEAAAKFDLIAPIPWDPGHLIVRDWWLPLHRWIIEHLT